MPKVIMVKPWNVQYAADVLYKLYAEQNGLRLRVTVIPKTQEELKTYISAEGDHGGHK